MFKVLKITTIAVGILNNLLYIPILLGIEFIPDDRILKVLSFFSFFIAVLFFIAIKNTDQVSPNEKFKLRWLVFLLNIISLLWVVGVIFMELTFDDFTFFD